MIGFQQQYLLQSSATPDMEDVLGEGDLKVDIWIKPNLQYKAVFYNDANDTNTLLFSVKKRRADVINANLSNESLRERLGQKDSSKTSYLNELRPIV